MTMHRIFLISLIILTTFGVVCCSVSYKDYNSLPVKPKITSKLNNLIVNVELEFVSTGRINNPIHNFIKEISSIKIIVFADGIALDSVEVKEFNVIGTPYASQSISTHLTVVKNIILPKRIDKNQNVSFDFYIKSGKDIFYFNKNYNEVQPDMKDYIGAAVDLKPEVIVLGDSAILFQATATRMKIEEGEYLPNSETFRVEVISANGKRFWASNENMNFLQVIGRVMPENVGESHIYSMEWNLKDNFGNFLPDGRYAIRMVIPAKPNHYIEQLYFDWKTK